MGNNHTTPLYCKACEGDDDMASRTTLHNELDRRLKQHNTVKCDKCPNPIYPKCETTPKWLLFNAFVVLEYKKLSALKTKDIARRTDIVSRKVANNT